MSRVLKAKAIAAKREYRCGRIISATAAENHGPICANKTGAGINLTIEQLCAYSPLHYEQESVQSNSPYTLLLHPAGDYMGNTFAQKVDTRKARLSDPKLLEIFLRRRKSCLENGFSLVAASNEAHEAVDEVMKRVAPPKIPDAAEVARIANNAGKWESEI